MRKSHYWGSNALENSTLSQELEKQRWIWPHDALIYWQIKELSTQLEETETLDGLGLTVAEQRLVLLARKNCEEFFSLAEKNRTRDGNSGSLSS